jgi:hypothetical protein
MGYRVAGFIGLCGLACQGRDPTPAELSQDQPGPTQLGDGIEAKSGIAGAVGGSAFDHVAAAFLIESPESERTTVIYLTSNPVQCVDLSFSGWDRLIATGTLVLQLKVVGKLPGRYLAVSPPTVSPREGTAKWIRNERPRPSSEMDAQGGWITIDTLSARGPTRGSFELEFAAGRLIGKFNAVFCPNGHEP